MKHKITLSWPNTHFYVNKENFLNFELIQINKRAGGGSDGGEGCQIRPVEGRLFGTPEYTCSSLMF